MASRAGSKRPARRVEHDVDDALLYGAPLVVRGLDLVGENLGPGGIRRREQLEGARRVVETPHGVQAGRDAKGDLARRGRASGGNAGAPQERGEARSARIREAREAPGHEDAVLSRERHHVGDGRERRDLREGGEPAAARRGVDADAFAGMNEEGFGQLPGDDRRRTAP